MPDGVDGLRLACAKVLFGDSVRLEPYDYWTPISEMTEMPDKKKEPEPRLGRYADQTIREMIRDEIDREKKNLPIRPYPAEDVNG